MDIVLKYPIQVLTDSHSPAQFRINGPLANLKEFSQVNVTAQSQIQNAVKLVEMMIYLYTVVQVA